MPRLSTPKSSVSKAERAQNDLEQSVKFVKGVGEKLAQILSKKGIRSVRDLLYFFPRTYEDRRRLKRISDLQVGEQATVIAAVRLASPVFYSRSHRRAFEVLLEDLPSNAKTSFTHLKLTWFSGAPYLKEKLSPGTVVMVSGEVKNFRSELQMTHPEMEVFGKPSQPLEFSELRRVVPVYSETEGLFQKTIRKIADAAVTKFASLLKDPLPEEIRTKYRFPLLSECIRNLHQPLQDIRLEDWIHGKSIFHERLIYEEFFTMSSELMLRKRTYTDAPGLKMKKPENFWQGFKANLRFRFTEAQRKVLHEILEDMESGRVMHRLIQGDVGSGKTVVAAAAALIALEQNFQVAVMAPTEVLIRQHFESFSKWYERLPIRFQYLTGSLSASEKNSVLSDLRRPGASIVFGTHALFEANVEFANLGLIVIDEQHRFGVRQRASLIQKGTHPHVLVMTATPIPRTLALTVYGDLDFSVIDQMPAGRQPIVTKVFTERFRSQLEFAIRRELELKRQVYIVFPLIQESEKLDLQSIEKMLPHIREAYPRSQVEYLHGKMSAEQRLETLRRFKTGEIEILVSTTVIEVGVDVPNATVMVIENAERFGLSQLHQLRGRVGRGEHASYCFLMASHQGSPEIVQRLRAMETTQDGFKLSEIDLEMRGPGEFTGTRQSGLPVFQLGRLPRDFELLQRARRDASEWVEAHPNLSATPGLVQLS